jgi:hypothetical protein
MRLNIASGTAVRFEPGSSARWNWWTSPASARSTASAAWCKESSEHGNDSPAAPTRKCSAPPPATACGWPTPTSVIEVEDDYTLRAGGYGEGVKFGGGKTIRDGMAQSQRTRAEARWTPC